MQLCLQKGFIINKIPNNNYSPLNFHSPLLIQRKVKVKMTFLQDHMVIASFVGKKPLPLAFSSYIAHFNHKLGGDKVIFDSVLGWGFFMLKIDNPNIVQKILMSTPFKTTWGIYIF